MWMNVLTITEDAASLQPASMYLTASIAPVILASLVMDLPAQVNRLANSYIVFTANLI